MKLSKMKEQTLRNLELVNTAYTRGFDDAKEAAAQACDSADRYADTFTTVAAYIRALKEYQP